MRSLLHSLPLSILLASGAVLAQTSGTTSAPPPGTAGNPALKNPSTAPDARGATGLGAGTEGQGTLVPMSSLERGSNSFTENQARARLQGAGFDNVSGLAQDAGGIWRGTAQMGGRQVSVGVDYRGSIAAQ